MRTSGVQGMRIVVPLLVLACAAVSSCHRPGDFVLGPDDVDGVLLITSPEKSIAADGVSRMTLSAKINPKSSQKSRKIDFTTNLGTLIGDEGSASKTATATADLTGTASVTLVSEAKTGTARIDAAIKEGGEVAVVTRSYAVEFIAPVVSKYFRISADH